MKKYTIVVQGKMIRNLSQGKTLRMHRTLKQQNIEHMVLTQKQG